MLQEQHLVVNPFTLLVHVIISQLLLTVLMNIIPQVKLVLFLLFFPSEVCISHMQSPDVSNIWYCIPFLFVIIYFPWLCIDLRSRSKLYFFLSEIPGIYIYI